MRRAAWGLVVALWLPATAALAQEAVFPPGSAFGLVPPADFTAATGFTGFASPAAGASIVLSELPAAAFPEVSRGMTADALAGRGIELATREDVTTPAGPAVLVTATQTAGERAFAKWVLVVQAPGATGLVTATAPAPAEPALDRAMRAALPTVAFKAASPAEKLAALPFTLTEGPTLKVALTLGGSTALLSPGGAPGRPGLPVMVVAWAGVRVAEPDRAGTARRLANSIVGLESVELAPEAPPDAAGRIETRGTAVDAKTDEPTSFVQWLRFEQGAGYLRIIALAPTAAFAGLESEFQEVAGSVARR